MNDYEEHSSTLQMELADFLDVTEADTQSGEILSDEEQNDMDAEIENWKSSNLDFSLIIQDDKYNSEQLKRIRWGIEKKVDHTIYADPRLSANEMEMLYLLLISLKDKGMDKDTHIQGIGRFVCLCIAKEKEINTAIVDEIKRGIVKDVDVSVYADPAYTYRQMRQIRMGLESNISVTDYANPEIKEVEMASMRKALESVKSKSAEQQKSISEQIDQKIQTVDNVTSPINKIDHMIKKTEDEYKELTVADRSMSNTAPTRSDTAPASSSHQTDTEPVPPAPKPAIPPQTAVIDVQKAEKRKPTIVQQVIEKPALSVSQLQQIYLGQRFALPVTQFASVGFTPPQMHEIRMALMSNLSVVSFAKKEIPALQMREIRKGLAEGFSPNTEKDDVLFELRKFQMSQVLQRFPQINAGIFRGLIFSKEQAEEICIGRQAGLGVELQIYARPDFDPDKMREIRLGLMHGIDAESYASVIYSAGQMREIRLLLETVQGKKKIMAKHISLFREKRRADKNRKDMAKQDKKE